MAATQKKSLPITTTPSKLNHPLNSKYQFVLDEAQQAIYEEYYSKVYNQTMHKLIASAAYKNASVSNKILLLHNKKNEIDDYVRKEMQKYFYQHGAKAVAK